MQLASHTALSDLAAQSYLSTKFIEPKPILRQGLPLRSSRSFCRACRFWGVLTACGEDHTHL